MSEPGSILNPAYVEIKNPHDFRTASSGWCSRLFIGAAIGLSVVTAGTKIATAIEHNADKTAELTAAVQKLGLSCKP